ncbi:uncharacterized protein LOC62_01G001339 [Vanrija pseudolonga]|uniref:Uncharacterized protein n=1 Tax=Vanrija pseudolonga TaxID=143232 RepID=A0AAF1BFT4_9TREE|nr:hypothetical protein LOC62_01G001339 [Vanrija pseudolonga]
MSGRTRTRDQIFPRALIERYEGDSEDANDATDADADINEGGDDGGDGNDNDSTNNIDHKNDDDLELKEGSEVADAEEQPEQATVGGLPGIAREAVLMLSPQAHSSSEASTQLDLHAAHPVGTGDLAVTKPDREQPKSTVHAKASRWARFQAAVTFRRKRQKH